MFIATAADARVVSEKAQTRQAGSSTVTKIRLVQNPQKKSERTPARFFNGEAWGTLGDQLAKLSKGDIITCSGELKKDKYTTKEGVEREDDVMVITHFRVQKSDSFFGREPEAPAPGGDDNIPF